MKPFFLILSYHVSPQHGWVEVPATIVDRLGILDQISEYSFYSHDKQQYYLEEDSDMRLVLDALKLNKYEFTLRIKMHNSEPAFTRCARVGSGE